MFNTSSSKRSKLFGVARALILIAGFCLAYPPRQGATAPLFISAHVTSASDIPYPPQTIAIGTVVLEVTVTETGKVESVLPIRGIDTLTQVASDSVKTWHFSPASLDGKPVRSRTTVAVTFNPAAIPAANVPLPPLSSKANSRDDSVPPHPADVLAAAFPQYPVNSVAAGTVVLRVTVDETGKVARTTAVRRIPALTSPAIRSLEGWSFASASFDGKPVRSSVALAFIFRLPLPGPAVSP